MQEEKPCHSVAIEGQVDQNDIRHWKLTEEMEYPRIRASHPVSMHAAGHTSVSVSHALEFQSARCGVHWLMLTWRSPAYTLINTASLDKDSGRHFSRDQDDCVQWRFSWAIGIPLCFAGNKLCYTSGWEEKYCSITWSEVIQMVLDLRWKIAPNAVQFLLSTGFTLSYALSFMVWLEFNVT